MRWVHGLNQEACGKCLAQHQISTELNNIKTESMTLRRVNILVGWHCPCFLKLSPTNWAQILCPRSLQCKDPNAFVHRLWLWGDRWSNTQKQFADKLHQKGSRGKRGHIRAAYESSLPWSYYSVN